MTIERYQGELYCFCDECGTEMMDKRGNTARYEPKDFDILVADMKEQGWKSEKVGELWRHYCPDDQ